MSSRPIKLGDETTPSSYGDYLTRLSEKSKSSRMASKSHIQIEREKKEQGFCLYFNGDAHQSPMPSVKPKISQKQPRTRSAPLHNQNKLRRNWDNWKDSDLFANQSNNPKDTPCDKMDVAYDRLVINSTDIKRLNESLHFDCQSGNKSEDESVEEYILELPRSNSPEVCDENVQTILGRIQKLPNNQFQNLKRILRNMGDKQGQYANTTETRGDIVLRILSNWGDRDCVGLTGLTVQNKEGVAVPIKTIYIDSQPSLSCSVLHNGVNKTTRRRHMWSIAVRHLPCSLVIKLKRNAFSRKLRLSIWNFNMVKQLNQGVKNYELFYHTASGNREVLISRGVLDKGTGNPAFNFATNFDIDLSSLEGDGVAERAGDGDEAWENFRPVSMQNPIRSTESKMTGSDEEFNDFLEKSWRSIDFFNRYQAGRLSKRRLLHQSDCETIDDVESEETSVKKSEASLSCSSSEETLEAVSPEASLEPRVVASIVSFNGELPLDLITLQEFDPHFPITELPQGKELLIDLLSTWGDIHYIGLTGVEVFSSTGEEIAHNARIAADPASINVLPEYGSDPRVAANLLNGVNQTRDDFNMWLAPFTAGKHHFIRLTFTQLQVIAMIRIWNYNKSRVHSFRGAKDIAVYLDNNCIFQGEIAQATGLEVVDLRHNSQINAETILFTTSETVLELVAQNDPLYRELSDADPVEEMPQASRPRTAERLESDPVVPMSVVELPLDLTQKSPRLQTTEGRIVIRILSNWSDQQIGWVAFDALQLLGPDFSPIAVRDAFYMVDGHRLADSLLPMIQSNEFVENAWFGAFSCEHRQEMHILLQDPASNVAFLRFWNCNTSPEDCSFGIKHIEVACGANEGEIQRVLLRKGFGHTLFDHGQLIQLGEPNPPPPASHQGLPRGFVFQLNIYSAWSDAYYVGLNGLALLGPDGFPVALSPDQVHASPDSVNVLATGYAAQTPDVRTPDKLVDGVVEGPRSSSHSWLAPILADKINKIFIVFEREVCIAGIQLWNYTKNPDRGVREFSALVDGHMLASACLPQASNYCEMSCLPNSAKPRDEQSQGSSHILAFDANLLKSNPSIPVNRILNSDGAPATDQGQPVKWVNVDSEQLRHRTKRTAANEALRPMTGVRNVR